MSIRLLGTHRRPSTADAGSPQPVVELPVSVMFPGNETVYLGKIVGLLASQRGRRIALVRLAVENGPRQDDFRAPWFPKRPDVEAWAEVAQFPSSLQAACFPREGATPPGPERAVP